ncbi:MAG TPA: hypothetical protein VGB97_03180 [Candidatus Paceibacterota bacterium]|jgi:hypothetical protein
MHEWGPTRIAIKKATEDGELPGVALSVAKAVAQERKLTPDMRKDLISTVRAWTEYAEDKGVRDDDLFMVRWHLEHFAQQRFNSREASDLDLQSTAIDHLVLPSGETYKEYVEGVAGGEIFEDRNVAIFGGTSRAALKLHAASQAGLETEQTAALLKPELPLNDIDIIVSKAALTGQSQFTADLAGTRVVEDIETDIPSFLKDIDCTFNQSIIHQGKLFYTPQALQDALNGTIRFTDKEDALFGSEIDVLPDGKKYINRKGLYRGFAFLLRGKAQEFPIHKDNLNAEVPKMGRYWVVLLMVKLMSMKDEAKRKEAIGAWYNLAHQLHATTAESPKEFLEELVTKHPEMLSMVVGREKEQEAKFDAQVRWLSTKLIDRSIDAVTNPEGSPPLEGMSDEEVVIDETYFSGGQEGVAELLAYISELKGA